MSTGTPENEEKPSLDKGRSRSILAYLLLLPFPAWALVLARLWPDRYSSEVGAMFIFYVWLPLGAFLLFIALIGALLTFRTWGREAPLPLMLLSSIPILTLAAITAFAAVQYGEGRQKAAELP